VVLGDKEFGSTRRETSSVSEHHLSDSMFSKLGHRKPSKIFLLITL
jgi:hypothetical protein